MGFFGFGSNEISFEELTEYLEKIRITSAQIRTEKTAENLILKKLREEFPETNFAQQYSVGGYLGLKVDIDVDNGDIGIEIKLAKQLQNSAANIQRLFGQVVYYSEKKYDDALVVLIIGSKKLKEEPFMKELTEFLEEKLDVTVVYLVNRK